MPHVVIGWPAIADVLGCRPATARDRVARGLPVVFVEGTPHAYVDELFAWMLQRRPPKRVERWALAWPDL